MIIKILPMKKKSKCKLNIFTTSLTVVSSLTLIHLSNEILILKYLKIFFLGILVLFLPGYWLSKILFKKNEIDFLELITTSFALSIALESLSLFYLNLMEFSINKNSIIYLNLVILFFLLLAFQLSSKFIVNKKNKNE